MWRDAHLADPKWTTTLPPANHHATNTKRIFEIAEPDQGTKDMVRRSGGSLVGRTASDDAPERGRGGACAADGARRAPSAAHRDLMGKPTYRRMRGSVRPRRWDGKRKAEQKAGTSPRNAWYDGGGVHFRGQLTGWGATIGTSGQARRTRVLSTG